MRAAATPMRVLDDEDGLVEAATLPRTSTCSDGLLGARAVVTRVLASLAETALSSTEKLTVA